MPLPRLSRMARFRGAETPETRAVDMDGRRPYLPLVPLSMPPGGYPEWLARIGRTLNSVAAGNLNAVIDVALTTGASTVVYDDRIGMWSAVLPMPETATAAAAISGGMWFVPAAGQVTIHHAANVATDRYLRLVILG